MKGVPMEDRCVICGKIVPEGRQICWSCDYIAESTTVKNKIHSIEKKFFLKNKVKYVKMAKEK